MIITVCADKGAPGVTTVALLLGVVWPGRRMVCEIDPSGADLPFRLRRPDGSLLAREPSIMTVGAAARMGIPVDRIRSLAQPTSLGVDVVYGPPSVDHAAPLRTLWPQIAAEFAAWPVTVICDAGRLSAQHAALPVVAASRLLVVVTRTDTGSLYRVRDRIGPMAAWAGLDTLVAVVGTGPVRRAAEGLAALREVLAGVGSPAQVAGWVPADASAAGRLDTGMTRSLAGSDLMRSTVRIGETLLALCPGLVCSAEPGVDHVG